jgi:hypothetical protein
MEFLVRSMAIDVISYAVLPNHLHILIRTRPDIAKQWSAREVAIRRLTLTPGRRQRRHDPGRHDSHPTEEEIRQFISTPAAVAKAQSALSDPGFFHKLLKEPCARLWNAQDDVTGHFWEGRFKSPRVLDAESVLRVARYIDLNEIRAAIADSIPSSIWSSAYRQWLDFRDALVAAAVQESDSDLTVRLRKLLWKPVFACRRGAATCSGTTPDIPEIPLAAYLEFVETGGRTPRQSKAGFIEAKAPSFLESALRYLPRKSMRCHRILQDALATASRRITATAAGCLGFPASVPWTNRDRPDFGSCYGSAAACQAEALRRGLRKTLPAIAIC